MSKGSSSPNKRAKKTVSNNYIDTQNIRQMIIDDQIGGSKKEAEKQYEKIQALVGTLSGSTIEKITTKGKMFLMIKINIRIVFFYDDIYSPIYYVFTSF